jgi:hypothetical protein
VFFRCGICGRRHEALPPLENGVPRVPESITTSRNKKGEWYFHCSPGGCTLTLVDIAIANESEKPPRGW